MIGVRFFNGSGLPKWKRAYFLTHSLTGRSPSDFPFDLKRQECKEFVLVYNGYK